ncbi:MAG: hypothetical protein MUC62_02420 [Candidatus Thermoplasmatota archaeon]|jgi:hypothetical protein|nr:hypothetical protein [Candidatus Thermoplasmatota archaeon]
MGLHFLCSRTEVLRTLWFDTGRKVLMIGAPPDFIDWIDMVLPEGSWPVGPPEEVALLLDDNDIKIVLVWLGDRPDVHGVLSSIVPKLGPGTDLWAVTNRDELSFKALKPFSTDWGVTMSGRLGLTTKCDLAPLVLRSRG